MTRLEFLQQVVEQLARATDPRLRGTCLGLLARQTEAAHLEVVLFPPWDLLVMSAAMAQCELMLTGKTFLREDPLPRTPLEAALHFLSVSSRMRKMTKHTNWTLMMWVSIAPFKHARPSWGSA